MRRISYIFTRDPLLLSIAATLITVSGVSWAAVHHLMREAMVEGIASPTQQVFNISYMVSSYKGFTLFTLLWVLGILAMMFPAMVPVVGMYARLYTSELRLPARVLRTLTFIAGYILLYSALGVVALLAVQMASSASSTWLAAHWTKISGAALVITGSWQFSPTKARCLSNCVSPIGFFLVHQGEGSLGSLKMGISHGSYCIGCCWLYMVVMIVVAAMSLPTMILLTLIITVEKAIVRGSSSFSRLTGVGFMVAGIIGIFGGHVLLP